jgi:hypothetical protein
LHFCKNGNIINHNELDLSAATASCHIIATKFAVRLKVHQLLLGMLPLLYQWKTSSVANSHFEHLSVAR